MDYFQSTNILSVEDYALLMQVKDPFYIEKPGCIIIDEDGKFSIEKYNKIGASLDEASIFNYKMDIEGYSVKYHPIFIKLLYSIKTNLESKGIKNPRPYVCHTYRNNKTTEWHRHTILRNTNRKNWYCVIYYAHPNWNTYYGGQLRVSKIPDFLGEKFECFSNSFVAHNGFYGHAVEELKKGYEGNRDIFLTHWVTN